MLNGYSRGWRIAPHTYRRFELGIEIVRLHGTDIYERYKNGDIYITYGHWQTMTTKHRINKLLFGTGWTIYQKNYEWYLCNPTTGVHRPFGGGGQHILASEYGVQPKVENGVLVDG